MLSPVYHRLARCVASSSRVVRETLVCRRLPPINLIHGHDIRAPTLSSFSTQLRRHTQLGLQADQHTVLEDFKQTCKQAHDAKQKS